MTYKEFLETLANAYDAAAPHFGPSDDAYMCLMLADWSATKPCSTPEEAKVISFLPKWNPEWKTYEADLRKIIKETEHDVDRCFADHIRSGRWGDNVNKARAKWLRKLANKLN